VADSIGAPDPQLQAYEEHAALGAALEKLSVKERRVLEMAYFEGHSQAEISRRMGVSQMHISRLLRRALAQLRQLLEEV
jgi:RNA polymerase sigma-B factor